MSFWKQMLFPLSYFKPNEKDILTTDWFWPLISFYSTILYKNYWMGDENVA